MAEALGMIETRGLIGAITAADAALKAAYVTFIGTERVDPAQVTITVSGEVAAVQAAVEAGAAAAERVGELIAQHVIPRPHDEIPSIYHTSSHQTSGVSNPSTNQSKNKTYTIQDLENMTVVELRQLARKTRGLGIRGRAISKANQEGLIQELARVLLS